MFEGIKRFFSKQEQPESLRDKYKGIRIHIQDTGKDIKLNTLSSYLPGRNYHKFAAADLADGSVLDLYIKTKYKGTKAVSIEENLEPYITGSDAFLSYTNFSTEAYDEEEAKNPESGLVLDVDQAMKLSRTMVINNTSIGDDQVMEYFIHIEYDEMDAYFVFDSRSLYTDVVRYIRTDFINVFNGSSN